MADLPILFSAPMVQALLREIEAPGTGKTQTRRGHPPEPELSNPVDAIRTGDRQWAYKWGGMNAGRVQAFKLPYAVGDRLYVREHWRCSAKHDATPPRDLEPRSLTVFFEAGGSISNQAPKPELGKPAEATTWSPSGWPGTRPKPDWVGKHRQGMHMPRWASRITLEVTGVKVERLQVCSEADAIAEGCKGYNCPPDHNDDLSPLEEYRDLWDQINGPGAWEANPWVAAYTFRPILGSIDQMPEVGE